MYSIGDNYFAVNFDEKKDFRKAQFFLGKSDLLFALACDFPGLYRMPMAYVAAVRKELKRLGWKVERSDYRTTAKVFTYRIFYFGPKPSGQFGTYKRDADAFKVYFYGFPEGDDVNKH